MPRTPGLTLLSSLAPAIGRRAFVRGVLGASAAAAVPPARARATPAHSVAIVGAGISGLSAALALRDRGITPVVFDANPSRIGGRMHSESALWGDASVTEYCGEAIDTGHTTMRALAKRFGLSLVDQLAAQPPHSESVQFFGGRYHAYAELQRDFVPVYAILQRQLQAAGRTTFATANAAGTTFDRMNVAEWIDRYVPGGRRSPLGAFIDVSYLDEYGLDTHEQSALNLIEWLGRQPDPANFNPTGPSDSRFRIAGGNARLPGAIAATLPHGAFVAGARLVALRTRADGRVALTFDGPQPRERTFDHAIIAIPFSTLRSADLTRAGFPPRKLAAIERLGYGRNAKLTVQYTRRVWNGRGPWPGIANGSIATDGAFQSTWDASRGQSTAKGILTNYVGESSRLFSARLPYGTTRTDPTVDGYARRLNGELERIVPGARAAYTGVALMSVPASDWLVLGSYSCWLTGQYTQFAGYEGRRCGNVHFAGEHTSRDLQGYMEGAAREGIRAAIEAARA